MDMSEFPRQPIKDGRNPSLALVARLLFGSKAMGLVTRRQEMHDGKALESSL
jgi:hypothetical protein